MVTANEYHKWNMPASLKTQVYHHNYMFISNIILWFFGYKSDRKGFEKKWLLTAYKKIYYAGAI